MTKNQLKAATFSLGLVTVILLFALVIVAATARSEGGTARQQTVSTENIVDLTHTLTEDFPYNSVAAGGAYYPFRTAPLTTIEEQGSGANQWKMHEHLGTQIDAPSHFSAGGMSLDQMPVEELIAPLAVIDISERAKSDPDATVTVDDVRDWEARYGRLPRGAAVFMNSGWAAKVDDPEAFLNLDDSDTLHFPGFAPETVEFLLRERQVVGIGVDTLSIDAGESEENPLPVHKAWHDAGKWNVECVANLDRVPPSGATVFVGATKVVDATGGPVRLISTFPSEAEG